jgi:hypothetical protein
MLKGGIEMAKKVRFNFDSNTAYIKSSVRSLKAPGEQSKARSQIK